MLYYIQKFNKKVINMLEKVNDTKDLKKLTIKEKEELAKDIRKYIILGVF